MITFSIIQKSQLEGAHRLDAEYFQPEYLKVTNKLSKIPHDTLENISESLLSFGAYSLTSFIQWKESGIPFITAENVKEGFIDLENARFIDEKVDKILKKSRVYENEVLLTMSGKVGDAAVAVNIPSRINSNQDIVKIKLKKDYSPYFLAVFLNSKFGRLQVLRLPVGSVQQHIFLWQTKSLLTPKFSKEFVTEVETLYKSGLREIENSKLFYQQAENLLLEELGLENFVVEDDLSFVVNLSDVKNAKRVDAEYFQPKYERVILKIRSRIAQPLGKISTLVGHSTQPPYDEQGSVAVLAQKHMKRGLLIDTSAFDNYTNETLIKKGDMKFILREGDVLVSSAGGPGLTCVWTSKDKERAIPGSFVTVVRFRNELDPLYAGVFMNSLAGKLQFERNYSGSVQQYVYPAKIKEILIPVLPKSIQGKIADLVRKSHEARKKSKELLEEAKRKVEEMVEKGSEKN